MKLCRLAALTALCTLVHHAAAAGPESFPTPLALTNLDAASFAEFMEGVERPITPTDARDSSRKPQWILFTDTTAPGYSGLKFGDSRTPGRRHLRLGFRDAIRVGSVLMRGGGAVSVLKPGAAFPGNLDDDSQWIPAQRLDGRTVSQSEVGRDSYALWSLPVVATTRALRLTHTAEVTEKEYAGWVGGARVIGERLANLAPQAVIATSANEKHAGKLINEKADGGWGAWENLAQKNTGNAPEVSEEHPEWLLLTWPAPVKLRGLAALWAGFSVAQAQAYHGPSDTHPREAAESAWETVRSFSGLRNSYPSSMGADLLGFEREVTTRALRLRITRAINDDNHSHVKGHAQGGRRVWLGELMALHSPGQAELKSALLPATAPPEAPPIAVKFTLPDDGWVTLVIEDAAGKRVRNLIAETWFPKGQNTVGWDGSDDLGRDTAAAGHGLYLIPTQLVPPGRYRVRGLWRKQVDLKFEMGVYNAGRTPWETPDKTGGWLANHTPPMAVLFSPDAAAHGPSVLIGSYVSEGGSGLAWVDLDGHKWRGQNWVGGTWTGAPFLARDSGPRAIPGTYAYAAAAWNSAINPDSKAKQGEIRITGLTAKEDKPVAKYLFTPTRTEKDSVSWEAQMGGMAAHNGVVVVSLTKLNQLVFIDATSGKTISEATVESPRGLAFDDQGRLLVLSGSTLHRYVVHSPAPLPAPTVLVKEGLEDPASLALDRAGNIFVSDRGGSHQVKVWSPGGRLLRTIGKPGAPKAGPYDPLHLNHPRGLTVDAQNRLWVAEEDSQPKRVSVWDSGGKLLRAFYGPADYGGGGALDPQDKTRFYYNGMEFRLDWERGTSEVVAVLQRNHSQDLNMPARAGTPETAIHAGGRRYLANGYNSNPTGGSGVGMVWLVRDSVARPIAAAGRANDWSVLQAPRFKPCWPDSADPKAPHHSEKAALFLWSDLNDDGQPQPDEVRMQRARLGGVTVMRDLSFTISRVDGKAMRFAPTKFTPSGAPVYELSAGTVLCDEAQNPPSSGGDQVLAGPDGWVIHTTAPKPFHTHGIAGVKNGVPMWSYPSAWPGLHAAHEAPVPDRPGMIIGHTRLLGDFITPRGGEPMWVLNGNHGPMNVFTADGLFVAQLFHDMRLGRQWQMPVAQRSMLLNELTPSDENFWPSVTQTPDGNIYVVAGRPNCIVRVDGLETVRRIAPFDLEVRPRDIDRAREHFARVEVARQAAQGRGVLDIPLLQQPRLVDGNLDDWSEAAWVDIDKRGTSAYFNANSKPYDVTASVAASADRLYAAWRTGDKDLLRNAGDVPNAPFKTGGCLDLMIGANAAADAKRSKPVEGDQRLLITQAGGRTRALLYRAVVSGGKQPVPFSSPARTITFDRVEDVSDRIEFAGNKEGNFEISIPLSVLGLQPVPGQILQGDIGILRGQGGVTTQRVYWSNKATAITADVPSEAELLPRLWGRWRFVR